MKEFFIKKITYAKLALFILSITPFTKFNAQINVLWESRFTSSGTNSDSGKELAIDAGGNVYVTGTSYTNGTNGYDIVTIKYDALGNQQWVATYNGTGNGLDEGRDIAVDVSGNIYVTGYTTSSGSNYNYVTIMYNSSGVQQWATTYNGTGNGFDEAYSLAIDNSGNCYVTGGSDAGSQGSNFVTIKYNNSGVQQWATSYNGPGNNVDAATQIKLDASNNVYVSGHSYGSGTDLDIATVKYNNSGNQQWVSRYDGTLSFFDVPDALYVDASNNVYVAGASYGGLATQNDYVTIMIDNAGNQQWAKVFDGPLNDEDQAFDIIADQNQNVYVTGRSMGAGGTAENMVTIKYDSGGNIIWQDTYDGPASAYDDAQQMRLGVSGALYVTGYSAGTGTNNDYLTLKYDTLNGNILWKARFDGPASNSDQAFAMEIDATESIYVTGSSTDPSTFKDYSTIKWCQLEATAGADVAICLGDNTPLDATTAGAISYDWSPGTGLSDSTVANPTASPTTTTMYTVAVTNALGCVDLDTVIVTVNPLPLGTITTSGSTTFCDGDSVTLTAVNSGTYYWNPTGDTTQSIIVYNSGNYDVTITDSNNCVISGTDSVFVNNLPIVSAGSDINLCMGDSILLNATGANTYTWNTQTTLSDSTISNPLVYPLSTNNYWVTGVDSNGCENIDTVIVAVSISPTAVMSNSTSNDTLDLNLPNGGDIQFFSNLSVNAIGFNWNFGDGGNSTQANPVYTYVNDGDFIVTLIASNGGCTDTVYGNITVLQAVFVGSKNISDKLSVYPNPANHYVEINVEKIIPIQNIEIYDNLGRLIQTEDMRNKNRLTIITDNFLDGIYYILINTDKEKIAKKLSISH